MFIALASAHLSHLSCKVVRDRNEVVVDDLDGLLHGTNINAVAHMSKVKAKDLVFRVPGAGKKEQEDSRCAERRPRRS